MTALRKILIEEEPVVTAAVTVTRAPAPKLYVVPTAKAPADAPAEAPKAEGSILKNILLFFAAPFLGLAYIVALPFVGLGFLAVVAVRARSQDRSGADGRLGAENCRDGDGHAFRRAGLRRLLPGHRLGHAGLDWGSGGGWGRRVVR